MGGTRGNDTRRVERIRVGPVDVHLARRGDGPLAPVVMVHSTGLSGAQWRRLGRRLDRRGHHVAVPDLIGYGETDAWPGPGPFVTGADLAIVEAVMDLVGGPVHLVGHSYGGRVALQAAARRPELVRSMAMFEPVAFGVLRSTRDPEGLADIEGDDRDPRFIDDGFGGSEGWMEMFVDYWNGEGAWAAMHENQRRSFMRSARKIFEEVRETSLDDIPHTAYEPLEMPALFISGRQSTPAGRRTSAILGETLPAGRHVEVDAGHMAPVMAPDDVNALILEHFEAVEPST